MGLIQSKVLQTTYQFSDTLRKLSLELHTKMVDYQNILWDHIRAVHILGEQGTPYEEANKYLRGCYRSLDGEEILLYSLPKEFILDALQNAPSRLEILDIRFTQLRKLDLSTYTHLYELQLLRNDLLEQVEGLGASVHLHTLQVRRNPALTEQIALGTLKNLRILGLSGPVVCPCVDVTNLNQLKAMHLNGKDQPYEVIGLAHKINLERLGLCGTMARIDDDYSTLTGLKTLTLWIGENYRSIRGLKSLHFLQYINLRGRGGVRIPDDFRGLPKMVRFDLSGMELENLPVWLPEMGLPFKTKDSNGIVLRNTKVKGVDMSIFDQSQEVILDWFRSRAKVPLQEVKVVFLGDGEAGKTHTIARLLNDGNAPKPEDFDDKATPGIVIRDKPYEIDGKTVKVHFWDFGGQEILHSMHRMFLTERTLYVVLLNARDDTQDDRARYWLHNIRAFAEESPVLLVLNKIDQNPNANVNEPELKELYCGLRRVVNLSALEYTTEQFNAALTDALREEILALGTIGNLWPTSWAKLKTGLETMAGNYITGTQYKQMCLDSGVDKNQKDLLHWFNDLGVSFCYEGNRRLEHYVILRPEWITNGIYILLFNKSNETKNGVIPKQVIYEMLDPEDENAYHRVLGGVTYDVNETEYVLEVMRKFRLSYAVSNEAEFIPALCQRNSMPIATEYANDPNALEFCLTYDYLPDNVIHRLMVEMRQDLQLSDVWRTGALFRQTGTGLSAVVKSEGDVLRIFVRSDNSMHRPNTYLCILKENIDRINRDMKLAAPFAEVVYKTARGKELFDYEDLLNAFEEGREGYRSKKLRRDIPIQDILNQTGRGAELALEKLRDDILTACLQMQQNRSFWTANEEDRIEDERNTYLRDTLINLRYKVSDQHLQGLGGGSRGYGELDLDIRRESAIPWTILEALRIKDGSKTDWNRHLKKLLDNYNPSGMRHLFLLTYVDCSKDDFEEILRKFSEHIKWHDEGAYVRLENTFSHIPLPGFGDPYYLKVIRCTYDRSGAPTTVTHIFVRMGE